MRGDEVHPVPERGHDVFRLAVGLASGRERSTLMTRAIESLAALQAAHAAATELLNSGDAAGAVALAEDCIAARGQEFNVSQLRAAMYTDGGQRLGRSDLVKRGAELWRQLEPEKRPNIAYNLANAELAIYELTVRSGKLSVAWQETREHLRAARALFEQVGANGAASPELRMQALSNAGNAYDIVGRYLDALTSYDRALAIDPDFVMALGNRGVALEHAARLMRGHAPTVLRQAAENLDAALAHRDSVIRFGGPAALTDFQRVRGRIRAENSEAPTTQPRLRWSDPYLEWCRRHELFLHVSHACLREDTERLDPLYFRKVVRGLTDTEGQRVNHLVDGFDALKQDFVAARYLTWLATDRSSPIRDHSEALSERVTFLDSLTYARWGVRTGLAIQSLAAATNVLDKVASFVHLYLNTARRVRGVYFDSLWREKGKSMDAELATCLDQPNIGLLALCDLSCEVGSETSLGRRVLLRHTATHRFLVAHTEIVPASDEWFDRLRWSELVRDIISQLGVARASLIYLARLIDVREHRQGVSKRDGRETIPAMPIPPVDTRLAEYE